MSQSFKEKLLLISVSGKLEEFSGASTGEFTEVTP